MENVATYSEARSEYTKQLATFIVPALISWFRNLWTRNSLDKQRCLSLFQNECEEVSNWNMDRIHDEVRALIEHSRCDYMEELMTAVFVAHTKVLTAVRLSQKQKKLSITVPKLDHFLHHVFKESARCFWKNAFLFMDNGNVIERQKNILHAESLLTEALTTAVRGLLPVKQILKDYMGEDDDSQQNELLSSVDATPAPTSEEIVEPQASLPPVETKVVEPIVETKVVEPIVETKAVEIKEIEPPVETKAVETVADDLPPSILKIDTEPSVKFSEYDEVFDEEKGEPEMRHVREDDSIEEGILNVDENSTTHITADDIDTNEDIEPPTVDETINDSDVVCLD